MRNGLERAPNDAGVGAFVDYQRLSSTPATPALAPILALSNTKPGYARTGSFITTLHEPRRSLQAGQRRRWH